MHAPDVMYAAQRAVIVIEVSGRSQANFRSTSLLYFPCYASCPCLVLPAMLTLHALLPLLALHALLEMPAVLALLAVLCCLG